MKVFVFNSYFPDTFGFSMRIKKQIDFLATKEEIAIVCRQKPHGDKEHKYITPQKKVVPIYTYTVAAPLLGNPKKYIALVYELYRNIMLCMSLGYSLFTTLQKLSRQQKHVQLYVVSSPLTVPLIAFLISKLFPQVSCLAVDFHDLEPELAIAIKYVSQISILMKIEYFLEKIVCQVFQKVIVTNPTQAEILAKRTHIHASRIFSFYNTVLPKKQRTVYTEPKATKMQVGYITSLGFSYTYEGLLRILEKFPQEKKELVDVHFLLIGDGPSQSYVADTIKNASYNKYISLQSTKTANIDSLLDTIAIGIIPWNKDQMTQTLLPTKLFDYWSAKKPVIAPRFGEFQRIIQDGKNGFLYANVEEFYRILTTLVASKQLRKSIGESGHTTYITNFNPEKNIEAYYHFLQQ